MKKTILVGLLFCNCIFLFGQSVSQTILLLPDTGQTTSYTTNFGEDNDYAINTPSFANLNNGTLLDNVTGLRWQQVDGGEMTYENAIIYCDNLVLGGYSDWRLPSPMESFSILNMQNTNPAINSIYFQSLTTPGAEYWWTNSTQIGDVSKVWCTNAGGGIGNKPKLETISAGGTFRYHVRCVRTVTPPIVIPNHFTDNGDGTITDNLTQLVWQKTPNPNVITWEQALTYAEALSIGTASDWRLPNIKELQSLNNEAASNPSVFSPYFSGLGVHNYWSSTSLPNQTSKAWYWNTQFGITTYDLKTNSNYVFCVRGTPVLANSEFLVENQIKVFPNPFHTNINLQSATEGNIYELYSNLGWLIYRGNAIEKQDFLDLTKGIYFLKVTNKFTTIYKLIKD